MKNKNTIELSWSIGDVHEVRPDLNVEQCRAVLKRVKDEADANVGVNWDTLEMFAEQLFGPERTMYRNYYRHTDCPSIGDTVSSSEFPEWEDVWDSEVDEDCPECVAALMTPYKSEEFVVGAEQNAEEIAKALSEPELEIERIDDDALVTATYPDGFQVVIDRCDDNEIEIRLWKIGKDEPFITKNFKYDVCKQCDQVWEEADIDANGLCIDCSIQEGV